MPNIYIPGHNGMAGSAVWQALSNRSDITLHGKSSKDLDLRDQAAVFAYVRDLKPDAMVIAAARVGGILANNTYPWQFLYENLIIEANLLQAAHENDVKKVVFLGSSCIYPKLAAQPLTEDSLLTGPLERTNEWYAIAKIAGVKMVEAQRKQYGRQWVSLMPTNLYGPNDNFDLTSSHVLPAMIRKFHEAKMNGHTPVTLWGDGSPMREFMHVDDLASAVAFALDNDLPETLYNVGTGSDLHIRDLAAMIQSVTGHEGEILWDTTKPNGTPRKLMDVSRLHAAGWKARIPLEKGLRSTYTWFLEHQDSFKSVQLHG